MRSPSPSPQRRIDSDGVTHVAPERSGSRAALWIVGGGLVFTVACLVLSGWLMSSTPEVEASPPIAQEPLPVERLPEPAPYVARAQVPPPSRPAPQVAAPAVEAPSEPPAPQAAPYTGPTGMGLYQRGTKPLKRGILVPEGFELPPGYMRHYQATDDGERVAPILMFHPDYKPLDANGQPLALPENRVVPVEMAPAGMPIQMLELPKEEAGSTP
ncbi:hypothetical protein DRW03_18035 [Corallococcus sp. H22C18031201]|uniref:hypothetical protein n=1 Tax=Citreicoccus inhibens TaxID=2849499 RepID=UPI000E74BAFB|nr:hypothetical protein [Citreicoccus inhibens]MBU8898457.1 hypothetical protein [Citreicoccus inhibens]RJS21304.1 hypothetical protein DRW03_18035 [Corallococcus sp. H22C18031201]